MNIFQKVINAGSKLISKIRVPFTHKKMTESRCIKALNILQDGDIILTHTSGEFSNLVLDYWSHAGIYVKGKIYEATTESVKKTSPMFFLARKDDILIMRPILKVDAELAYDFLEENLGKSYDFEFESNDGQFYCFELVAETLNECSKYNIQQVRTPIGKQYLAKCFIGPYFSKYEVK